MLHWPQFHQYHFYLSIIIFLKGNVKISLITDLHYTVLRSMFYSTQQLMHKLCICTIHAIITTIIVIHLHTHTHHKMAMEFFTGANFYKTLVFCLIYIQRIYFARQNFTIATYQPIIIIIYF